MRVLVLILVALSVGCAHLPLDSVYKAPTFSYQSTNFTGISFSDLDGVSHFKLYNSNPYALPLSDVTAELWVDGKPFLNLDGKALQGLAAQSESNIKLDWTLIFEQLFAHAGDYYDAGEIPVTLKLSPTFDVPFIGQQTLHWSQNFSVPLLKLPELSVLDWQISELSFSSVTVALELEIFNPNSFSIRSENWALSIEKGTKKITSLALANSTFKGLARSQ